MYYKTDGNNLAADVDESCLVSWWDRLACGQVGRYSTSLREWMGGYTLCWEETDGGVLGRSWYSCNVGMGWTSGVERKKKQGIKRKRGWEWADARMNGWGRRGEN